MKKSDSFLYWKHTWQKWICLIGGILLIISLSLNIKEYIDIAIVKDNIFSPIEWKCYSIRQCFQCAITGFSAALFIGILFIGIFAKSKRIAQLAEGLLLIILTLSWSAVGLVFHVAYQRGINIIWGLILFITFCGSLYSFWKSRNY